MKKTIIFLLIFLIFAPAIHAEEGFDIVLEDNTSLVAEFDNCTKISQENIPAGNFTTLNGHTFHGKMHSTSPIRTVKAKPII